MTAKQLAALALIAMTSALAACAHGAQPAAPPSPTDVALAQRFSEMAHNILRGRELTEPHVRAAAAMLEAALELDSAEPRYPRLLADARLQLRDTEGALRALTIFRKLRPADQGAQVEVIELHLARMQTLDERLKYLRELLPLEVVPAEVRSIAAEKAAAFLSEKGRADEAEALLNRAIQLDPLNGSALIALYRASAASAPPQRVRMLLEMLRSNPDQADVLVLLAAKLSGLGMHTASATWYGHAVEVFRQSDEGLPLPVALDYAAVLYRMDQTGQGEQALRARGALDDVLTARPDFYPALIIRLLAERRHGEREMADRLAAQARNVLVNQLEMIRSRLGVPGAATRPVDQQELPAPDLAGDVDLWRSAEDEALKDEYLQAVGDLAWFEVYFNQRPAEAQPLLRQLSTLRPEKSGPAAEFRARLEGWIFLLDDKKEEARVKLSASPQDPLAALGLIRAAADPEQARAQAAQLLSAHPGGLQGDILWDALRDMGVKPVPAPGAAEIQALLEAFPADWMRIITHPQEFYSLHAQPLRIAHPFGDPMLARVTITNLSDHPITISQGGVIHPSLWFDAELTGMFRQAITGVCIERLTEQRVLRPRQSIIRVVRIDQGPLQAILQQNPIPAITLKALVRTNPRTIGERILSDPCGYAVDFAKPLERLPLAVNEPSIQRLAAAASAGEGRERIGSMELLAVTSRVFRQQLDNPGLQARADEFLEILRKGRTDANPNISAWAGFLFASYAPAEHQSSAVQRLLLQEPWQSRLLGLAAAESLPPDRRQLLIGEIARKESNPTVRQYGAALMELSVVRSP